MKAKERRVVITGLGMVSPVGLNVEDTWSAILAGKSGVAAIDHFDASDLSCRICSRVKGFDPTSFLSEKEARKKDTFIQYGIAAAIEAMRDSGLVVNEQNADRIGLAIGSGIGGLPMIEKSHAILLESGPRRISPFFIPGALINMIAGNLSIMFGMRGPNIAAVTACTTGTHNIGLAARAISYGDAEVMLAGASEMASTKLGIGGFAAMRALSTRNDEPEKASRPWDKDRDGFVLGEGAGMLVLESEEHAKQRGAKIYAEIVGFGMSGDASHITTPHLEGLGAALAMEHALRDAGMKPEDIDYINAHGTSTPMGDELEILGVKRVFKDHAYQLAMSSTKSMIGHLLGAAGAVEAIFSVLAIRDQVAPPTINLDYPDEGCDLNLVAHHAQQRKIKVTLSNSFGFGVPMAPLFSVNIKQWVLKHRIVSSFLFTFILLNVIVWGYFLMTPLVTAPQGVRYYLRQGTSLHTVIQELTEQGVITHPWLFSIYSHLHFADHHLKTGEYLFQKGTRPGRLLDQITKGKGFYYYSFTVIAGWNFHQLRDALLSKPELQHLTLNDSDQDIMRRLGCTELHPEGQFYPETYFYVRDSTDLLLLQRSFNKMQTQWNTEWQKRSTDLPYKTSYDALIAASLIEKEAKLNEERYIISGILKNRLQKNMLLQIDPTVIYGLGDNFKGKLRKRDLEKDTPYNTYTRLGLPPTPIAMPSLASMQAVLHPELNDYLYFVAKGDGSHQFSKSLEEHHVAVSMAKKIKKIIL